MAVFSVLGHSVAVAARSAMENEDSEMKIKEFRIVMPLSLDEFRTGQTFTVSSHVPQTLRAVV